MEGSCAFADWVISEFPSASIRGPHSVDALDARRRANHFA
jgi:hypothetical protein